MARSQIGITTTDAIMDSGNVLWSFVKGEQLEYPITLEFLSNAFTGYLYECVVIEASNEEGQSSAPNTHKPAGVKTILTVRVPELIGVWSASAPYGQDDVVTHLSIAYRRRHGGNVVDATPPLTSSLWETTTLNTLYVQFPKALASTWTQQPTVTSPTYGFFELRVTENFGVAFKRTWKPVRGLVEILFSPTEEVPDA